MTVTVYSKKNCPACEQAKKLLTALEVPYEVKQIDNDLDAFDFIASEGHRSMPQIYKDGKLAIPGGFAGMQQLGNEGIVAALT